jgi:3-isopropylmalate/(R)-2-methylmalate dehydratase large subunit
MGFVAPDETVFDYLKGRSYTPKGDDWAQAVLAWRSLCSDAEAIFDAEIVVDMKDVAPSVTWGTSPEHAVPVDGVVPDPAEAPDESTAKAWRDAQDYMGLQPGQRLAGTKLDRVFIGSCTNSRLSDLQAAAAMLKGGHVAAGVTAWVVPGSEQVKRAAESEGLDQVFRAAGFDWREPGCSMCVAANGDFVPAGQRAMSTTNRNFVGRQGPGARTHLASPQMAALAAITGVITDPRGR